MKLVGSTVTDTTVLAAPELARHGITASDVANGVGLSATTQAIDAVSDAKAAFDLAKNVVDASVHLKDAGLAILGAVVH